MGAVGADTCIPSPPPESSTSPRSSQPPRSLALDGSIPLSAAPSATPGIQRASSVLSSPSPLRCLAERRCPHSSIQGVIVVRSCKPATRCFGEPAIANKRRRAQSWNSSRAPRWRAGEQHMEAEQARAQGTRRLGNETADADSRAASRLGGEQQQLEEQLSNRRRDSAAHQAAWFDGAGGRAGDERQVLAAQAAARAKSIGGAAATPGGAAATPGWAAATAGGTTVTPRGSCGGE
uniref:Uncharacterized protein n=1 Tax=Oryza sativa subsp. japonica TaxID=39947 RepID=Q6YSD4_ORYSJ|nr:hypothetical protein [Oryza sativa Japonica Group]